MRRRAWVTGGVAMAAAAAGALLIAPPAGGDDLYLKGGGRLTGVIVERTRTAIVIETAPGRVGVPLARVERVVEGRSALAEYRQRAAGLAAADVAGWLELARWAEDRRLLTPAREAYERVLRVDPANAPAHAAVGHVRFGGAWMAPDEARRAQGLVEFEGEWMTPEERAALRRAREEAALAEKARAEADARAREAEARAREAEARAAAESSGDGVPLWWGGVGAAFPCLHDQCCFLPEGCGPSAPVPHPPPHVRTARPRRPAALAGASGPRPRPDADARPRDGRTRASGAVRPRGLSR